MLKGLYIVYRSQLPHTMGPQKILTFDDFQEFFYLYSVIWQNHKKSASHNLSSNLSSPDWHNQSNLVNKTIRKGISRSVLRLFSWKLMLILFTAHCGSSYGIETQYRSPHSPNDLRSLKGFLMSVVGIDESSSSVRIILVFSRR